MPGAVWAIDGTFLDRRVGRRGRRALVVVELQSRKLLKLKSVRGECIDELRRCLQELVLQHGAPLVLKLDNGSAFVSVALAEWCATHGITLLHSPVRRPSYNGTCEVSGRWGNTAPTARPALAAPSSSSSRTWTTPSLSAAS